MTEYDDRTGAYRAEIAMSTGLASLHRHALQWAELRSLDETRTFTVQEIRSTIATLEGLRPEQLQPIDAILSESGVVLSLSLELDPETAEKKFGHETTYHFKLKSSAKLPYPINKSKSPEVVNEQTEITRFVSDHPETTVYQKGLWVKEA